MWKLIILSLLAAVRAHDLDGVYGDWTVVAIDSTTIADNKTCTKVSVTNIGSTYSLTCRDGKTATKVRMNGEIIVAVKLTDEENTDTPWTEVSCTEFTGWCGLVYPYRHMFKTINKDYTLQFVTESQEIKLLSRYIPKHEDLVKVVSNISELKGKKTVQLLCASAGTDFVVGGS